MTKHTGKTSSKSRILFMQDVMAALQELGVEPTTRVARVVRAKKSKNDFLVRVKARKTENAAMSAAIRAKKASKSDVRAFVRGKSKAGTQESWRAFAKSFGYDV